MSLLELGSTGLKDLCIKIHHLNGGFLMVD